MSEDETGRRPARFWHFFLDDMVAFAEDALSYTAGMDQSGFESNGLVFDATLRKLELIGEAARNVPEEVRTLAPGIPLRLVYPGDRSSQPGTGSFMPTWASTTTRSGASCGTICPG